MPAKPETHKGQFIFILSALLVAEGLALASRGQSIVPVSLFQEKPGVEHQKPKA